MVLFYTSGASGTAPRRECFQATRRTRQSPGEHLTRCRRGRIFAANHSVQVGYLEVDPWLTVQP
jgi:hypothetical protein